MYEKHNIYLGRYEVNANNVVTLPKSSYWRVMTHMGEGYFVEGSTERGKIALILSDDENIFWPIISFLDDDEVRELANELLDKL